MPPVIARTVSIIARANSAVNSCAQDRTQGTLPGTSTSRCRLSPIADRAWQRADHPTLAALSLRVIVRNVSFPSMSRPGFWFGGIRHPRDEPDTDWTPRWAVGCYGERLRRARATTEARIQLTVALEIFERLGARPWVTRAASELRAAGRTDPRTTQRDRESLTPQELKIAELAAAGLTNKQIGQRLFLSHRTVGAHLYQIFPKLGVTSRAALRDALASLPRQQRDQDRT
jgi:DNA-binding CsgD family transcriptional regulator